MPDNSYIFFRLLLIDFVLPGLRLIQVCLNMREPETRERELGGLIEAMRELGVKEGKVVTLDESEAIETSEGLVELIPFSRFLTG